MDKYLKTELIVQNVQANSEGQGDSLIKVLDENRNEVKVTV